MKSLQYFLVGFAVLASVATAQTNKQKAGSRLRDLPERPYVKRGVVPDLRAPDSRSASAEETAQIKKLIASLTRIERPDFGLSATMSGMAFAPVPGTGIATGGALLTDHQLQTAENFRKLVAFGPRALPFLLAAIDDKTPTKLKITQGNSLFTCMMLDTELKGNPTNSLEQKTIESLPEHTWDGSSLDHYTVKVGDVCFVIIGQIVGRAYLAVRYQPTAIIIVNSPVEKKELANAVREIWSSTNATQKLFDSLLFDYSTEGIFNGKSLDGWGIASELQCQAAMRMLYFFPRETSQSIADRLAHFDVRGREGGLTNAMQREAANGVRVEEFIKSVAWTDDSAIRQELLNIFRKTTDTGILLAAVAGVDASANDLVRTRLNEMIDQLPADESGPYGQGYELLVALGEKVGAESKPTFARYLQHASLQRWRSMAHVLRETRREWAVELLSPALNDTREFGWTYALVPGQNEPRRRIRVCDEAAETISLSRPDLHFRMAGEHVELDRQIAAIQARLKSNQR